MTKKKTAKKMAPKTSRMKTAKDYTMDIIQLILEDHKPLKKLIKTLKDSDASIEERREAFEEFAPLLLTHAKPEEESLYVFMKNDEELREEGYEGDVEHQLADQLVEEINRTTEEDLWSARAKVLAELVEHHIEEEEAEMLPDFKKNSEKEDRMLLAEKYSQIKSNLRPDGNEIAPGKSQPEITPRH